MRSGLTPNALIQRARAINHKNNDQLPLRALRCNRLLGSRRSDLSSHHN